MMIRCTVSSAGLTFKLLQGCRHTVAMRRHPGSKDRQRIAMSSAGSETWSRNTNQRAQRKDTE